MTLFGKTVLYFMCWSLWYGVVIAALIGIAFHPILIVFSIYFSFIPVFGVLCGIWSGIYHARVFHHDIDVAVYRRRAARSAFISVFVLTVPAIILESLAVGMRSLEPYYLNRMASWMAVGLPFLILAGLLMAYIGRQCVAWLAADQVAPEDLPPRAPNIAEERNRLLKHMHQRWIVALAGIPAACIQAYWSIPFPFFFLNLDSRLLIFIFIMIALFLIACCAQGNAIIITFVKVLILEDYFPNLSFHRHRVILTILSFLYTLVTTWWTLILAPLYAVFMAYHVYHTLALPADGYDKAKREEKNAAYG